VLVAQGGQQWRGVLLQRGQPVGGLRRDRAERGDAFASAARRIEQVRRIQQPGQRAHVRIRQCGQRLSNSAW
jgi:hypothetical protein